MAATYEVSFIAENGDRTNIGSFMTLPAARIALVKWLIVHQFVLASRDEVPQELFLRDKDADRFFDEGCREDKDNPEWPLSALHPDVDFMTLIDKYNDTSSWDYSILRTQHTK